jgi:ABC-2 type transport system permease protein
LFLGLTLFYFFADVAKGSLKSIVSHGGLLRKLKFPRYIIIISGSVSAMITLAINLCVVTIFALFMQVQFSWSMLIIIPVILEVYVFALGLGFFLSALYVKFRDIEFIWELVQQALFYGSMVLFPAKLILDSSGGVRLAEILLMNPLAQAVQDVRNLAISETIPSLWSIGGGWLYVIPIGIALLTFAFGVFYFRSKSPDFAEDV